MIKKWLVKNNNQEVSLKSFYNKTKELADKVDNGFKEVNSRIDNLELRMDKFEKICIYFERWCKKFKKRCFFNNVMFYY